MTLPSLGWIGTGVMGRSMAGHLLSAGYSVTVYSRTRAKCEALLEQGARWAGSPAEVAATSEVVLTMVGYPSDVESVYLGEDGVFVADGPTRLAIDFTTSEPSLAERIAAAGSERDLAVLDAPVSGGDVGARKATLSIMVGGDAKAFATATPIFEVLGATTVHQGAAGAGQHTKMVNQTLIATGMIGVCEALLYAEKAGLDPETVLRSVSGGAAGSWSLSNLAPRMLAGDYAPGFFVEHFIKDMGIALAEAERMHLSLPGLALAKQLYEALRAQGHARSGTQALILALRALNGQAG
ncbi:MAG: NAD(P)-dependent oxidoreductase [Planctomycetota bacterium]